MLRWGAAIAAGVLVAATPRSVAAGEVVVGVGAPLSGRQQALGESVRKSAERAIGAINATGGLLGERLVIAVEDDGCDGAKGALAAKAIADKRPVLVVGHPCASAAVNAAALYATGPIVFIATGVRSASLTQPRRGSTVFRLAGREDRQGEAAADWLARTAPGRRVGLVHDRTLYARGIVQGAVARLKAAGITPLAIVPIVAGRKEYDAVGRGLKEARAEAVLFAGYPTEARLVLEALRRAGSAARFLGSDSLAAPDFADSSAADLIGVRVLVAAAPDIKSDWRAEVLGDGGTEDAAGPAAAFTYGAVEAWAEAVRQAGSFDVQAVSAALARITAQTSALGAIGFDDNGDARLRAFAPAVWNGASWEARD